jgi:hypothetical protein
MKFKKVGRRKSYSNWIVTMMTYGCRRREPNAPAS